MREETLGQRLRRLRLARGLSQDRLSKLVNMSGTHVYQLESGRRKRMNAETARVYAEALGISEAYLLYGMELKGNTAPPPLSEVLRARTSLSEEDIAAIIRHTEALEARQRLERLQEDASPDDDESE